MKPPATPDEATKRNREALDRAKADPAATVEALRMLWNAGDATHETTETVTEAGGVTTKKGRATPTPAYRIAWFIDAFGDSMDPAKVVAFLQERDAGTNWLTLLAWGVERTPPVVPAETRPDPILPVVQSVTEAPEREAGRMAFGGILDVGDTPSGQLPLFPAPDGPRVALLELTDAHGVPTMAQGRGAPLELAVYVGACILTPYDFRARRARLVTSVRELAAFLFGPGKWRPGRKGDRPGDWQRVRDAALHASGLWLPVPHPDGAPDLWRAVAVRKIPPADYHPSHLDREVIFDVELPPGSSDGPPIDRAELSRLRRVSGPRFRAYLAAQSVAWRPGRTRVPHPGNRRFRVWTGDASKYPVLTAADRDRLAFGEGWEDRQRKEGRRNADAHWEELPGSVILTRKASTQDGRAGWLIIPEAAADAIRKRERGNRGK